MDKTSIGLNAGVVWRVLSNNTHWSYEDLKKASLLSDRDLNAAIGWLARENRIEFEEKASGCAFYVNANYYF